MNYQNLALCRFVYIWSFLFLLNIVYFAPTLLLGFIIIFELITQFVLTKSKLFKQLNNKKYLKKHRSILLVDIILFCLLILKSKSFYIMANVYFFIFYIIILYVYNTNIIELHRKHLANDDARYVNENYIEYLKRIWNINVFETIILTFIGVTLIHLIQLKI